MGIPETVFMRTARLSGPSPFPLEGIEVLLEPQRNLLIQCTLEGQVEDFPLDWIEHLARVSVQECGEGRGGYRGWRDQLELIPGRSAATETLSDEPTETSHEQRVRARHGGRRIT